MQKQNIKMELQRDSNPQPISLETNIQPFSQTGQMIEPCCEYLSVWCTWVRVLITPHTRFRVIYTQQLNVKEILARPRRDI